MEDIAVEAGGDLLLEGAVSANADGFFPLLVGEFGNVAEVNLIVGRCCEVRVLAFMIAQALQRILHIFY